MPFTMTNVQNLPERIESTRQHLLAALGVLDGMARGHQAPLQQAQHTLAEAGNGLQRLSRDIEMIGIEMGCRHDPGSRTSRWESRETPFTD